MSTKTDEEGLRYVDTILQNLNEPMRAWVQDKVGDITPPWVNGPFGKRSRGGPFSGISQVDVSFEKTPILTVFYDHNRKQFFTDRGKKKISKEDLKKHICVHLKDRKEAQLRVTQAVCEYLETLTDTK